MTSITTAAPVAATAPASASPAMSMETIAQLAISGDTLQSVMGDTVEQMFSNGGPGRNATATSMLKLSLQSAALELTTSTLGNVTSSTRDQIKKMANAM